MLRLFLGANVHSPVVSGAALARLITASEVSGVSGCYFEGTGAIDSSGESTDQKRARKLWRVSAALTSGAIHSDAPARGDLGPAQSAEASRTAAALLAPTILLVALAYAGNSAHAGTALNSTAGLWRTYGDDGKTPRALVLRRNSARGDQLSGTLAASLIPGDKPAKTCDRCPGERKGKRMRGLEFLSGMRPSGDENVGGEVLDANSGKVYRARVRVEPDGRWLVLRGFIGLSLFGRSQIWERVE